MRLAAAAALVGLAVAGCGGGGGDRGHEALVWDKRPHIFRVSRLPQDRVLVGAVRNDSTRVLRLKAADLRVRDAGGRTLETSALFLASYAHSLYGAFQKPHPYPELELHRLGFK